MMIVSMTLITLVAYHLATKLAKRFPILIFHPLILTTVAMILLLLAFDIPIDQFEEGTRFLTHMISPATIAFAIPIYKHFTTVKKYFRLLITGTLIGSVVAIFTTLVLALMFRIDRQLIISLLPRSITTPLAIEMATAIGAVPALTIAFVLITGILGALLSPLVFRLFKIETSMARGLALGMAAHAVGTTLALEYGEEAATFSTLAMISAGIITTLFGMTFLPWLIEIIL